MARLVAVHPTKYSSLDLPPGIQVPKGSSVLDSIQTLASVAPNQLMEVLAQMKAFVITHPEHTRILLVKQPQLAFAFFQALLLNKIVDSERMLAPSRAAGGATLAAPPPAQARVLPIAARLPIPHFQQQQPLSHYPPHMFQLTGLQRPAASAISCPAATSFPSTSSNNAPNVCTHVHT